MPYQDDFELRPGPLARFLCRIFGHTHHPIRYMRPGQRSVIDGIGRLHINIEGECARCEHMVEFGQLHVPHGPWEFNHRTRQYRQLTPASLRLGDNPERNPMTSWDAEHPQPVRIEPIGRELCGGYTQPIGGDRINPNGD